MIASLALLLSSCINDTTRAGRPSISQFSQGDEPLICGDLFLEETNTDLTCVGSCSEGKAPITREEIPEYMEQRFRLESEELGPEINEQISLLDLTESEVVCLTEIVEVERPSEEVFVKKDRCACLDGKPDILNNCSAFCSSRNTQVPTLFGSVTLGPNIALNEELGNLSNWCTKEIDDGLTGPSCLLEANDGSTTRRLEISIPQGANTFSSVISSLDIDKTYIMRIVEQTSGARSDPFQIIRKDFGDDSQGPEGPLKIMPISQYTCVLRSATQIEQDFFFENAIRQHFYFASNESPPSLSPELTPLVTCHDPTTGTNDGPLKPRLELKPQSFAVWDLSDLRFVDVEPQDDAPDINTIIQERLVREFDVDAQVNLFGLLSWPNSPDPEIGPQNLGIFMQAFVDPQTGRAFCPGEEEYFSDDPVFQILKEVVGVPTEGLYLAEKQPEALFDENGNVEDVPRDTIIIRENLLKKIWFYFENEKHLVPDERTANTKTIRFYYPPDLESPLVKKSTQRVYTIRSPQQLSQTANLGLPTSIPIPDKRFGCVPAIDTL